jgi:ATP phosphoribosyltransferase regulatory subunit
LAAIRAPFLEAGAEALDAPLVLPLALMLELAGEGLRQRLFVVQSDGREEICLRPDFTVPAALTHIASGRPAGRYAYEGRAYRVTRPGGEEPEDFLQVGLEIFGGAAPDEEDAEVLALAWRSASAAGRDDLCVRLGDAALFSAFLEAIDAPAILHPRLEALARRPERLRGELDGDAAAPAGAGSPRLAALLAGLSEDEAESTLEEIWRAFAIEPIGRRSAGEIVHRLRHRAEIESAPLLSPAQTRAITAYLEITGEPRRSLEQVAALAGGRSSRLDRALEAWERRLERLAARGTPADRLSFATAASPAFSYYDGAHFVVLSDRLGEGRSLAAGGRYDGLLPRLSPAAKPGAVGCMVRPARAAWAEET